MKQLIAVIGLPLALALAPAAQAKKNWSGDEGPEYAKVVAAVPVYRQVRVIEPRQECWEERVVRREARGHTSAAGAITGAIIGGVIGHQFGSGRGRDVATAAGAVIGANVGERAGHEGRREIERVGYETHCRAVRDVRYEDRVDYYEVTYRYHGRLYHTRLPYDPGERLAVDVEVTPRRH